MTLATLMTIATAIWTIIKAFFLFLWNVVKAIWNAIVYFFRGLYVLLGMALRFLGPVSSSVAGKINEKEVYRVVATSTTVGTSLAGLAELLYKNIDNIVTDPQIVVFVRNFVQQCQNHQILPLIVIVIFAADYFRRQYLHGEKP